ncbi:ECF RNA polymerase sigma factor SigK [Homoserinimonas sp. OAct 916]|uniref:ECF RNA polymerase sigma factor SigK n=1 Tax=Homoserinimonas sp. OAct 916 TaxID=2211450 RepID=UPI000DBE8A34|nr:ECF RNA polymerase sigma factor SigK [Homoserinimonas sp. OAct 916]
MPDVRPERPDESAAGAEAQLLGQVSGGDQDAFGELYDRFAPRVLGLVRRLLLDHAQAEEVTQEVFLEVWQSAGRFDPNKGRGATWIMTMAHRRAIDRIRSAQASRNRDTRVGIRDLEPGYDEVAENVEVVIEHERVKAAMARLSEAQRQAVSLAYYGGLTHSEIAAEIEAPIGTVKTRLRDGMIRLRDDLGVTS